jgi:hypothetical protein
VGELDIGLLQKFFLQIFVVSSCLPGVHLFFCKKIGRPKAPVTTITRSALRPREN